MIFILLLFVCFRLHMAGMSKQLLTEGMDNEVSIPWARQQLAVTVQKDEELVSSSPYAMFDSQDPVTNFSNFISDESIVDKVSGVPRKTFSLLTKVLLHTDASQHTAIRWQIHKRKAEWEMCIYLRLHL